jgi:hypothetical protein
MLLKEFKDVFIWIYKDLKSIPPKLAQHKIELDISIPLQNIKKPKTMTTRITFLMSKFDDDKEKEILQKRQKKQEDIAR